MAVFPEHVAPTTTQPTSWRRRAAQLFVFSVLSFWLILLVGGRLLISTVDQREQAFAQWLGQRLNMQVTVGTLRGTWQALDPHLEIAQLVMSTDRGTALAVKHAHIRIDTMASLRRWQLVFHHLEVDGLKLFLNSDQQGGLTLLGVAKSSEDSVDLTPLYDTFTYSREMKFDNSHINVSRSGLDDQLNIHFKKLQLAHSAQQDFYNRIQGEIDVEFGNQQGQVEIGLDATKPGALSLLQQSSYLSVKNLPLAMLQLFTASDQAVWQGDFHGQFWLDTLAKDNHKFSGQLKFDNAKVVAHNGLATSGQLDVSWLGKNSQNWQGIIDNIQLSNIKRQWRSPALKVSSLSKNTGVDFLIDGLDITGLSQVIIDSQSFSTRGQEILTKMALQGELGATQLQLQLQPKFDLAFTSSVTDFTMHSYKGSPALYQLSAQLWADANGLYVKAQNQSAGFSFPKYYDESWRLSDINGLFLLSWDQRGLGLAANLNAKMEGGVDAGIEFFIDLANNLEHRTYSMVLDVANAPALMHKKYVPSSVPKTARDWLDNSIKTGWVESGTFLYEGRLVKGSSKISKTVAMMFNLEQAGLRYNPLWPDINNYHGQILVDTYKGIWGDVISAEYFGNNLEQGDYHLSMADNKLDRLYVNAVSRSDASIVTKLLTQTPLRNSAGKAIKDWQLTGPVVADFALDIPLISKNAKLKKPPALVSVNATLRGVDVVIDKWQLELKHLMGPLRYQTTQGLSSAGISAEFLQDKVVAKLSSEGVSALNGAIKRMQIDINAQLDIQKLAQWRRITPLYDFYGRAPMDVQLSFGAAPRDNWLKLQTQLKGVHNLVPSPLAKTSAAAIWPVQLDMQFSPEQLPIKLQIADRLTADIVLDAQGFRSAVVVLGDAATLPPSDGGGLVVTGQVDYLNLLAWRDYLDEFFARANYQQQDAQNLVGQDGQASLNILNKIQLDVQRLGVGNEKFGEAELNIFAQDDSYHLAVSGDRLRGELLWHQNNSSTPYELNMQHLALGSSCGDVVAPEAGSEENKDSLAFVDPHFLPPFKVAFDQLCVNGEDFGSWGFRLVNEKYGASIVGFRARLKQLDIGSEGDAQLRWYYDSGRHRTEFDGNVDLDNIADVFNEFEYSPLLTSDEAGLSAQVAWSASPAGFSLKNLTGSVQAEVSDGKFISGPSNNALKLVGVLNVDTVVRRLRLDFSDIFEKGLSYDKLSVDFELNKGEVKIVDELRVTAPSVDLYATGGVNLLEQQIDLGLVVTLPVSRNILLGTLIVSAPQVGIPVYLAEKLRLFGNPIDRFSSVKYHISGDIEHPDVTLEKVFNNDTSVDVASGTVKKKTLTTTPES